MDYSFGVFLCLGYGELSLSPGQGYLNLNPDSLLMFHETCLYVVLWKLYFSALFLKCPNPARVDITENFSPYFCLFWGHPQLFFGITPDSLGLFLVVLGTVCCAKIKPSLAACKASASTHTLSLLSK